MTPADRGWLSVGEMMDGNDHNMPEQGKYNGGQKMMFWAMALCVLLLAVSASSFGGPTSACRVGIVRLSAVVPAAIAAVMIRHRHGFTSMQRSGPRAPYAPCGTARSPVPGPNSIHRAWYRE